MKQRGSMRHQHAHAVIIGVNQYRDHYIPDLKFARHDAETIYRVFTNPALVGIPARNVALLLDEQATQANIRAALHSKLLEPDSGAEVVYIYFAGHGSIAIPSRPDRDEKRYHEYLVPCNARIDRLPETALSIKELKSLGDQRKVKQIVILLDCSFNGEMGGRTFHNPRFPQSAVLSDDCFEQLGAKGLMLLSACNVAEVALELNVIKHGLFTYFLIEGIYGKANKDRKGRLTIEELYRYIYANVLHNAERFSGNMHPIRKGSLQQEIYIVANREQAEKRERDLRVQVNELYRQAKDAYQQGDIETVYQTLNQVLDFLPYDEKARKIVSAIESKRQKAGEEKAPVKPRRDYSRPALDRTELIDRGKRTTRRRQAPGTEITPAISQSGNEVAEPPVTATIVKEMPAPPPSEVKEPGVEKRRSKLHLFFKSLFFLTFFLLFFMLGYVPGLNEFRRASALDYMDQDSRLFRSTPSGMSIEKAKEMLTRNNFYERDWNPGGTGFDNKYQLGNYGTTLIDFASQLMWQQDGSPNSLSFAEALVYIDQLNRQHFAGYDDWRLPTLEEAMSVIENKRLNDDLHISRLFSDTQRWVWTADDEGASRKWVVYFYDGYCFPEDIRYKTRYVRAVR